MISFDQNKKLDKTFEGEAVRLKNDIAPKAAYTTTNDRGDIFNHPAKRGIHIETDSFLDIINWLADTRIKKSESSRAFVHRCLSVRFPDKYAQNKSKIDNRYKLEQEMIESNSKNDVAWFGEVGFSNMVRLDGSLTKLNNKVVINKDGTVKVVRN
tara:strand:- start:25 stop:489 length:465 start_codon:yes stop_codon:yes gene_type:complete